MYGYSNTSTSIVEIPFDGWYSTTVDVVVYNDGTYGLQWKQPTKSKKLLLCGLK